MNSEPIVALVGRRDEPTDGVTDYCTWLGGALGEFGYRLEIVRLDWPERSWNATLAELRARAGAWRGRWVLLQYTTLAWSRRGFPLQAPRILSVLGKSGARCGVVFHDFGPLAGASTIGRVREYCQLRVLERLYDQAERAIFTVPIENIPWVPRQHERAVFIPVGANCPKPLSVARVVAGAAKTIAVYSVTGGAKMLPEVTEIGFAVKRATQAVGPLRVVVAGRGSREAESALMAEFAGVPVQIETLGLLSAEDMTRALADSDVLLFVRGQISSRRGSAIAGIACGLPVVCYAGPDTGWPITEAGIVPVPMGDREALSAALESVLTDGALRASLAERSRRAYTQYFSWHAIAARYADVLGGRVEGSARRVAAESTVVARTR
jgi:glycosyltransferase involved in cell wall biosynthesis